MTHLLHSPGKCIRCGICAGISSGIALGPDGYPGLAGVLPEEFDLLVVACPAGALATNCRIMTADEVLDEVCKDRVFFQHGGGVTFSGGEPFDQFPFLMGLLKGAKERGLHTAVESSLFAPRAQLEEALPLIDELFADCKLFHSDAHLRCTGQTNARILENLAYALRTKPAEEITVRTPLIPGCTDSSENITDIAGFISQIQPDVRYELLGYNPLAFSKYRHVAFPFCFAENPEPYSPEEMQRFREVARAAGVNWLVVP